MSTPAGIQEVSLLPHPDRALQEVREAQAQPEVQVPPIRPEATEATIPEATQGTPATRTLPEIPATLPGVQEVQLQEARQHGFIQELWNLYQEFQQFLRKLFCKEFGQQLFQKLRQQLFERWKFQKLRRRLLRRRLQKFGRKFRRQQTQVASV